MVSGWVCFDLLGLVPILGTIMPSMGIFKKYKQKWGRIYFSAFVGLSG
jgi:hypothetical protein